eukprot:gene28006-55181_t
MGLQKKEGGGEGGKAPMPAPPAVSVKIAENGKQGQQIFDITVKKRAGEPLGLKFATTSGAVQVTHCPRGTAASKAGCGSYRKRWLLKVDGEGVQRAVGSDAAAPAAGPAPPAGPGAALAAKELGAAIPPEGAVEGDEELAVKRARRPKKNYLYPHLKRARGRPEDGGLLLGKALAAEHEAVKSLLESPDYKRAQDDLRSVATPKLLPLGLRHGAARDVLMEEFDDDAFKAFAADVTSLPARPRFFYPCVPKSKKMGKEVRGTGETRRELPTKWYICTGPEGSVSGLHWFLAAVEGFLQVHHGELLEHLSEQEGMDVPSGWQQPEDVWAGDPAL